ncbi:response regulator transcription factor, partial [Escherichia coli]|nr:response regulator transcription factor [Escherichia coli]
MNILIVEDDAGIAHFLQRGLRHHGLECDIALSGRAALALLTSRNYDAMVLDRMMPVVDGM